MKEVLFILLVLAVIVVLTAVRYRKQIAGMIQIWRALKSAREQIKGRQTQAQDASPSPADGPLVNCAKCKTWVPESRAINLRGGVFYCSTACLEQTTSVR